MGSFRSSGSTQSRRTLRVTKVWGTRNQIVDDPKCMVEDVLQVGEEGQDDVIGTRSPHLVPPP